MSGPQIVGPAANPTPTRTPKAPIVIPQRVAERAATRYVEDENGCHISTYSTASHGYAQIGWQAPGGSRSTMTLCHRAAWVYAHGTQIPDGMTIDHLCKNRRCVNPNHLRLLSNYENARRTRGDDWPIGECKHGHPNKYLKEIDGRWHCSLCAAQWQRNYRARKREREAA